MKVLYVLMVAVLSLIGDLAILLSVFDTWREIAFAFNASSAWTFLVATIVSACVLGYLRFKDAVHPVIRIITDSSLMFTFIMVWRTYIAQAYDSLTSWIVVVPASLLLACYIQYRNDFRAILGPKKETVQ